MSPVSVKTLALRRVRRQKQFIAVGSVALLALLGFELPKLLGGGAETAPAVTTVSPSLVGSSPIAGAGKLPDTDRVVIQRDSNQLLSFGLFKSKDPFIQQLSTNALPATTTSKGPTGPIGVGLTPVTTTTPETSTGASVTTSSSPGTTPAATTPTAPATAPTDVLISTNGVCQRVALKGTFPFNEDIFQVVSIAPDGKSVEIGVVGGSYDSGQATATLKLGETLTLVNTADGTRYVIALNSKCDVQTAPVPPATTTVTTTTTTSTTTSTTPIVTDSLDTTTPTG